MFQRHVLPALLGLLLATFGIAGLYAVGHLPLMTNEHEDMGAAAVAAALMPVQEGRQR